VGAGRTWALPGWAAPKERCVCPVGRTIHAEAPRAEGVSAEVREGCRPGPVRGREGGGPVIGGNV
jgi:hypothetical protein